MSRWSFRVCEDPYNRGCRNKVFGADPVCSACARITATKVELLQGIAEEAVTFLGEPPQPIDRVDRVVARELRRFWLHHRNTRVAVHAKMHPEIDGEEIDVTITPLPAIVTTIRVR